MRRTRETATAKRDAFLAAYAKLGTITHAAEAVGIDRQRHYGWMDTDPAYPALFAEAGTKAKEALVREATRRAIEGVEKPVYQGGRKVGTIREYSDTLLIFLMKGAMPQTYRERVDITMDITSLVQRIADEEGLDTESLVAEAERIVAGS